MSLTDRCGCGHTLADHDLDSRARCLVRTCRCRSYDVPIPTLRQNSGAPPLPRPEHVVKAEALREAADDWDSTTIKGGPIGGWLRNRADELDPPAPVQPAEPTGDRAAVRDHLGDLWWRTAVPAPDAHGTDPRGPRWWQCVTRKAPDIRWKHLVNDHGPVTVLSDGVPEAADA